MIILVPTPCARSFCHQVDQYFNHCSIYTFECTMFSVIECGSVVSVLVPTTLNFTPATLRKQFIHHVYSTTRGIHLVRWLVLQWPFYLHCLFLLSTVISVPPSSIYFNWPLMVIYCQVQGWQPVMHFEVVHTIM